MVSSIYKIIGAAVAAYLLAQQIECPVVAIPLITSAALTTAASVATFGIDVSVSNVISLQDPSVKKRSSVKKRQTFTAPTGMPQFEFERCSTDLAKVTIKIQGPVGNHGIQIDNVPPTCMDLASVLDDDAVGGPLPQPCGSACLLYDDLSPSNYEVIRVLYEELRSK